MRTLHRFFRHLFFTSARGRQAFPPDVLKAIQANIARGEQGHRAEIRLVIEAALPLYDVISGLSSRQRARELFASQHIWDTQENSGILVYVNLADHKVDIVADRGAEQVLNKAEWQIVCQTMTSGFARHEYRRAVLQALEQLHALLAIQLPANGARANELSNRPLML